MDFLIKSNTRVAIVVGAVAVGLGASVAYASQNLPADSVSKTALYGFVALIVCIWPIARRMADGTFDLFEPLVSTCAMLAILCGLRPIVASITGHYTLVQRYNAQPYFDESVLVGLVGVASFVAAYEAVSLLYRANPASRRIVLDKRSVFYFGMAMSAVALLLYVSYVVSLGGVSFLLAQRSPELAAQIGNTPAFVTAAPVALACAAALIVLASRGVLKGADRVQAIVLSLLPALLFVGIGNRRFILPCILLPLFVAYLASGRRPKTSYVAILVPVLFLVLATIPFARSEGSREQAGGLAPIYKQAFQRPADTISRFADGPDTDMLLYLSLQIQYQRSHGLYYNGRATLGDFAISPIPSRYFKNKPESARNDLLRNMFGAPCSLIRGGLCPDFSVIGTFYQDFALPGAIVGMALLGAFAAGLWQRFLASPSSPYLIQLVAATSIFLPFVIRAGLLPPVVWMLYFVIPCFVGIRYARRRVQSSVEEA